METRLLEAMLGDMVRARALNERFVRLKTEGLVPGPVHQTEGQEAIGVGVITATLPTDYISTYYRGMVEIVSRGVDLRAFAAEMLGRATGLCGGKGGEMTMADVAHGVMCVSGIVGGNIPVANGLGLAAKLRGEHQVAVAFFGEGATNTGAFHEALNMAGALRLPVLFVCVNNRYAISTHIGDVVAIDDLWIRAAGYGMEGLSVDGNDAEAVHACALNAIERARRGHGPTLIEAKTFRIGGHSSTNPEVDTMDVAEMNHWKQERDPIELARQTLVGRGVSTSALEERERTVRAEVDEAVDAALGDPEPSVETALEGLYV